MDGHQHIFLSIIIPVYNVQNYIEKCLESIFLQNVDENLYEVIFVNDGTPDNSMTYVDRYSSRKNVKIINQENQGLSVARNNGLKLASGDYVWFVDSDDWVSSNSIKSIILESTGNYDVMSILLTTVQEKNGAASRWNYNKFLSNQNVIGGKDYLFYDGRIGPTQQFIYKRKFLSEHNLHYRPNVLHEDGEFNSRVLYFAKSVRLINDYCYFYLLRSNNSIMSTIKMKNMYDIIRNYNSLKDFGQSYVKDEDRRYWMAHIVFWIVHVFEWSGAISKSDEFIQFYKENVDVFKNDIHNLLFSKRLTKTRIMQYLLIRFVPILYLKYKQVK